VNIRRLAKHLFVPDWLAQRAFPDTLLRRIEQAIAASESRHGGQLRFVVEAGLELPLLWRGKSARQRAAQLFSELRVWDTEYNSGVLIYVQLHDRRVEILADRGISARVKQQDWDAICRHVEQAYGRGEYKAGTLAALDEVTALLQQHFPAGPFDANELPDRPLVL
jgi:uncharacterized membrane protein YgcG